MNRLLIKGAHIIDPSQHLDERQDILIEDGIISHIAPEIEEDCERIDASGLYAAPGLVDVHVHLRDPGLTYKEDIRSGCRAAAAGGITSMICMPNTKPVVDTPETVRYILERASGADARVYPTATITQGMSGEELSDFAALQAAGAVGVSDDGKPVKSARLMRQAMLDCQRLGLNIMSHCEDLDIIGKGIMNQGKVSERLGVPGMDRSSEDSVTARELALAEAAGTPIHICHVSTKGSVGIIRHAKARGVKVTCETGPHYFMLTDALLENRNANFRMNPPLREQEDVHAILDGIRDGTIDVIATDHAPHSAEEKADFERAPNGIIGLETSFAASCTALVATGMLSLYHLIEIMSTRPGEIMGLPGGTLKAGAAADLVLIDPQERWTVSDAFQSKAKNSPYIGMELQGRVKLTLLGGRITHDSRGGSR